MTYPNLNAALTGLRHGTTPFLPDLITSAKNEVADEQLKLKRVSDLITAYEKIVEGDYIDNLICVQKEQEQTRTAESPNLKKSCC